MNDNIQIPTVDEKIAALIEGAYIQTPTQPGYWVKYDDVRNKFIELVSIIDSSKSQDFDNLFGIVFPTAKYEDKYQLKDTEDVFKAVRVSPNKLNRIVRLKKMIDSSFDHAPTWTDNWKPFAALGNKELKELCLSLGFASIRNAIECLFKGHYVFKTGDTTNHEPPVLITKGDNKIFSDIENSNQPESNPPSNSVPTNIFGATKNQVSTNAIVASHIVRNLYRNLVKSQNAQNGWVKVRDLMTGINWTGNVTEFAKRYNLQIKAPNLARISNISRYEILDDIYFDPQKNSYPKNLEILKKMALDELWEDGTKSNGLLDNYICYTYARVKEEGKIALSSNGLCGCWNTGLVDKRYLPIYCYLTRRNIQERWVFQGFCINGENLGKALAANISVMPSRALYFTNNNLLFESDGGNLSIDYDHIITEHPSRLPKEWVMKVLGDKYIEQDENEDIMHFDERLGSIISSDGMASTFLQTLLKEAIDISLMRCQWNYKTAIPYYDPKKGNIGWFLPLCIRTNDGQVPFAALVVTKENSGRYQGQTIYKLSWAYRCARLVCRPDSDWLTPIAEYDDSEDD